MGIYYVCSNRKYNNFYEKLAQAITLILLYNASLDPTTLIENIFS